MNESKKNNERAKRAASVLSYFAGDDAGICGDDDIEGNTADLLADIMHLAQEEYGDEYDFSEFIGRVCGRALFHFLQESSFPALHHRRTAPDEHTASQGEEKCG